MNQLVKTNGFKYVSRCKICKGKTLDKQEVRPIVETLKGEGKTNAAIIEIMQARGVPLSPINIIGHFKKHAPYVVKGTILTPETRKAVTTLTHSSENAKKALNNIIAMGGQMIDNWWKQAHGEEISGPTMPVTGKLFVEALKEEGKRAPKTALDADFEAVTKRAIEGEVTDEPTSTT